MISVIQKQKSSLDVGRKRFGTNFKIESINTAGIDLDLSPKLYSLPNKDYHASFIAQCAQLILERAVFEGTDRSTKVLEWKDPEELEKTFDFGLNRNGESEEKLVSLIEDVIKYSVKAGHPFFVNQLYSGVDPFGLIGQWLTDALNPSVYTYEVSPVFSVMEEYVLKEMRSIVGFPEGVGDGVFCPGGSISNGYGISCARYHASPDSKKKGLYAVGRLVLFTSEDAHYSIVKLASFMGLGGDNVILIPTDNRGKMKPDELEKAINKAIEDGGKPFMVSATAGTTVLGAFDPIEAIADICEKYRLWFHVDAAWGGGCLMSSKYRGRLQGIHRADSVTWNPHKLLAAPQQCSAFLTRHDNILTECHSANAQYLFQKDKFYNVKYDTGDKHIQCGRRADVLKWWFMWKAKGSAGLEKHINRVFDNAHYFKSQIESRKGHFQLVMPEFECTNICFWFIPPSLRNTNYSKSSLHKIAPVIKERMMRAGSLMVTYQPHRDLPNFFRLVVENSGVSHVDIDRMIQIFEELGADL